EASHLRCCIGAIQPLRSSASLTQLNKEPLMASPLQAFVVSLPVRMPPSLTGQVACDRDGVVRLHFARRHRLECPGETPFATHAPCVATPRNAKRVTRACLPCRSALTCTLRVHSPPPVDEH